MGTPLIKYLDPDVIRKVARLDLKAKFIIEGFLSGLHGSPFHGFSVEFSEHRKYTHGDEVQNIDWAVYARTDKYYIKKFQAETNLHCHLVVDISESMNYGSLAGNTKLDYAKCLMAALAYLMIYQQDPVGLITFDSKIRTFLPPKSRRSQLTQILSQLARAKSKEKTSIASALHELAQMIRHRGLIILFSDLLEDDLNAFFSAMHHLKFRGHDIIVFHILDQSEAKFPFEHPAHFIDPETQESLLVDPKAIREEYLKELNSYLQTIQKEMNRLRVDYMQLDTSMPFDEALVSFLMNRKKKTK
jgi:uncharacterized protein (DUF58 family)